MGASEGNAGGVVLCILFVLRSLRARIRVVVAWYPTVEISINRRKTFGPDFPGVSGDNRSTQSHDQHKLG